MCSSSMLFDRQVHEKCHERWEAVGCGMLKCLCLVLRSTSLQVAMTVSDGQFQQACFLEESFLHCTLMVFVLLLDLAQEVSFVNNIATTKGGTHAPPQDLNCWGSYRAVTYHPS